MTQHGSRQAALSGYNDNAVSIGNVQTMWQVAVLIHNKINDFLLIITCL